jgi:ankyrin repeat protein
MSLNIVPNELILYMGDFFIKSSLNALIQTRTRFATLLTPHLYDDEIRFQVHHPEYFEDYPDPDDPPPIRCLDCAVHWRSDIILHYLSNQRRTVFDLTDHHGRTLLHRIAIKGNAKVLAILLAKGVDIDTREKCNSTPLMLAVSAKNEELVHALLNAGADATASRGSITVLIEAIFTRSLSMVQRIIRSLQATTNDIFAPCTSSEVLHRAVFIGSEPIVRLLLDLGADHSTPDSYGTTSLTAAAIFGRDSIVNLLLDRGADVLAYDTMGRSALNSACEPIDSALDPATVKRLAKATVNAGGDISSPSSENRWTPLHHFALGGNVTCVELLIGCGADVLATGENGVTPLTCSLVRYGDDEIKHEKTCQVLIQAMSAAGADLSLPAEVPTGSGLTPLHLAASLGAESVARLLIEKGADVFALDENHCLPVVFALLSDHEAVCLLLAREMMASGHDFSSLIFTTPEATEPAGTLLDLATVHRMDSLCALLNGSRVPDTNKDEQHTISSKSSPQLG